MRAKGAWRWGEGACAHRAGGEPLENNREAPGGWARGKIRVMLIGGKMSKAKVIGICGLLLLALPGLGWAQKASKIPILNSISPTTRDAGSGAFILTATGSNFTTGSVVRWNGSGRSTTYISSTQLQATIGSLDIQTAGTAKVTVYTSGRQGGESGSVTFTIATPTTTSEPPPPPPPAPSPLAITTTSLPGGTAGTSYNTSLAASGGTPAYVWSLVTSGGALPPGLALQANGSIAGTPTQGGTFTFTAQASDQASQVVQKALSITVEAPPTTTTTTSTTSATPLFQDDFESGTLSKWLYVAPARNFGAPSSTSVVAGVGLDGSKGMQSTFYICGDSTNTACGYSHQDLGHYAQTNFNETNGYPNGLGDVFVSGHVKFHLNPGGTAQSNLQRKLFYLKGGMAPNQDYYWAVVLATQRDTNQITVFFDGGPNNPCGNQGSTSYYNLGQWAWDTWYWLQVQVKANTPGSSDGVLNVWINGSQVLNKTGLNLRGTCTIGLSRFAIGFQADRYNYDLVDESRVWDNVAISTSYINF